LCRYIVFYDLKAAIPDVSTSFFHIKFNKILIYIPQANILWGCYGTSNIQKKSELKN
jgi:hypothetical protein